LIPLYLFSPSCSFCSGIFDIPGISFLCCRRVSCHDPCWKSLSTCSFSQRQLNISKHTQSHVSMFLSDRTYSVKSHKSESTSPFQKSSPSNSPADSFVSNSPESYALISSKAGCHLIKSKSNRFYSPQPQLRIYYEKSLH